ncbi:Rho GTPase-activating protein 3 [Salvia divinorum]|uniref:Rho GTPase-activating protein 3 n=1 Tax=Salvia divinorum TaxID=28513 RepID=A0ABD1I1D7_SALDI
MTRRFRSKSGSLSSTPPPLYEGDDEDDDGYFGDFNTDDDEDDDDGVSENPATTPFLSPGGNDGSQPQFSVLGVVAAALRKSLVTCSVSADDVASDVDIGWPTDVRHVSHVTFDRFDGFLGLPLELQPEVPPKPPSASASVFGVSAESMQCSFDQRGNSIPTILLMMQSMLYEQGGLQAEGIFRINADNNQEESVRQQLNKGVVPHGIDVHCLSGLIKAWFRELPSGVLDCLREEDVMHCNTEEECSELVKQLPPTEGALLDWAINLMADVVQHHHCNKMNARNIAMVFAPNMTQMADPLTALVHAVQVMNFLKTLVGRTLAERQECEQSAAAAVFDESRSCSSAVASSSNEVAPTTTTTRKRRILGHSFKDEYEAEDGILHCLSLRRGMQKLYRHPVFHLTKAQPKKLYSSN